MYTVTYEHTLRKTVFLLIVALLITMIPMNTNAQQKEWVVRLARIEIDTAYLNQYKAAIEAHTRAAIQNEPGVLTLYVMSEKEHPNVITVLEIYANKEAYQLHLKTPHFLKYKTETLKMVKSLQLIDVDPVAFRAKPNLLETEK